MQGVEVAMAIFFLLATLFVLFEGIRWGVDVLRRRDFERKYQARYERMTRDRFDEEVED